MTNCRQDSWIRKALFLLPAIIAFGHSPAQAQTNKQSNSAPIEITTGADAYHKDVFRGLAAPKGFVFAPWTIISRGNFSVFGTTTHYTERNSDVKAGRVGSALLAIDYKMPIEKRLSTSVGYEIRNFPAFELYRTQAVRGSLMYEHSAVNLSLNTFYDFDAGKGIHTEFSAGKNISSFRAKLSVGYNHKYFRKDSGIGYAAAGMSIPLHFKGFQIEPSLSYNGGFAKDFDRGLNFGVTVLKKIK